MSGWSIRRLVFVTSTLFAVLVVGGIAVATYFIYFGSLTTVTTERAAKTALVASARVADNVHESRIDAGLRGFEGTQAAQIAQAQFLSSLESLRPQTAFGQAHFAVYGGGNQLLWSSGPSVNYGSPSSRTEALAVNQPVTTEGTDARPFAGLFSSARLATVVTYVPFVMPDGARAVLEVAYLPVAEERVLDSLRLPMTVLILGAGALMVLLIESTMLWVLRQVDQLRAAADSIDTGHLDARMPDLGTTEMGDLARALNRLIDRLQRRADSQSAFVANASHELATPVAGIRGYVDILRRWGDEDPQVREEAMEAIDRESQRMSRLTADLLNMLQSEGSIRLENTTFDLNALVRERLASTASAWLSKDIEFEGPEEDVLEVWSDRGRLEDVLSILLENAAKYTPEGGLVAVRTARAGSRVAIEVIDSGVGIPPEELPHVFDRFFRSSASRAAGESGFGLGLAIAKNIVEVVGGEIEVRSVLGEGTTFTVYWPRGRRQR